MENKIDRKQLAKDCDCTLRMIDYVLNGQHKPSYRLAKKIEIALGGRITRWQMLDPTEYGSGWIGS